jgi:RNA polymerase primary sigma factor
MTKKKILNSDLLQNQEYDSLAVYLKNVSKYKLLNVDDEVIISERMVYLKKRLFDLDSKLENDDITFKEHYDKKKIYEQELQGIKEKMIQANLRLVVSIAKNTNIEVFLY